ncbi:MAG: glycine--tRNA ligase [Patescibacteria group bacterium]
MDEQTDLMKKIISLCKRRGFIYPGSEIYGGLAGTWDYGPLGTELKRNIKNVWWEDVVQKREDMVGLDAAIMMNPKAWEASGHVEAFTDPLVECKVCNQRFRSDKPKEIEAHQTGHEKKKEKVDWTQPQKFNLLVKAYLGVIEGKQSEIFLRGEITNGVQVNFKNVVDSTRVKIPFGVAQIGKAFRNEITPGNFTFRSREFEQMETQFYIKPEAGEAEKWFNYWKEERMGWYQRLGINKDNLRFRDHEPDERAHYATMATDVEYKAPWGWDEFMGIHYRGEWDLSRHQKYSGVSLTYRDQETGQTFIPHDVETSAGIDRSLLFFLLDAFTEEEKRVVLKLHPKLAPFKAAVFPLVANKEDLVAKAKDVYHALQRKFMVAWDARGNIGKRYFSQDEIGTPWCITVDYQTLQDNSVTIRDRDTTGQERVNADELSTLIGSRLE